MVSQVLQTVIMIARFLLILAGLFAVGVVCGFLLYVSVLSLLTVIAVTAGLAATLVLGYWAGRNSLTQPPSNPKGLHVLTPINAADLQTTHFDSVARSTPSRAGSGEA